MFLKAIAGEDFPQPIPVVDADGAPVVNSQGTPVTTTTARGATYKLVRRGLQALGLDETVLCESRRRGLPRWTGQPLPTCLLRPGPALCREPALAS